MVKVRDNGGEAFTPCPEGNHAARVCGVVYLGTVHTEFKGVEKDVEQIRLSFELPSELRDDGEPFVVSTMPMTSSTNKKASFRKLAIGILGREPGNDFESDELLGRTCLVNIVHTPSKTDANVVYANITGTSPLPKGMEVPEAITEAFNFDVNTSPMGDIDKLPEFIQKLVMSTPEYKARIDAGEEAPF